MITPSSLETLQDMLRQSSHSLTYNNDMDDVYDPTQLIHLETGSCRTINIQCYVYVYRFSVIYHGIFCHKFCSDGGMTRISERSKTIF